MALNKKLSLILGDIMRLFCFPFSGSSASVYLSWFRSITSNIEVVPVELAGRNKRFSEPLFTSIEQAVADLLTHLKPRLYSPYALFGHSLGCTLIYELVQWIVDQGLPLPHHLFLSGSEPPHCAKKMETIHGLPDDELLTKLCQLGGISDELVGNRELLGLFLPILRADFCMYETYVPGAEKYQFPCDMTVLAGTQDVLVTPKDIELWRGYTQKRCTVVYFEGNHFFVKDYADKIVALIESTLFYDRAIAPTY